MRSVHCRCARLPYGTAFSDVDCRRASSWNRFHRSRCATRTPSRPPTGGSRPRLRPPRRRCCATPDAAQDVVQDVFVSLWTHPETYRPERGSLTTFVRIMARSRALDRLRSHAAGTAAYGRNAREALVRPAFAEPVSDTVIRRHSSRAMLTRARRPPPRPAHGRAPAPRHRPHRPRARPGDLRPARHGEEPDPPRHRPRPRRGPAQPRRLAARVRPESSSLRAVRARVVPPVARARGRRLPRARRARRRGRARSGPARLSPRADPGLRPPRQAAARLSGRRRGRAGPRLRAGRAGARAVTPSRTTRAAWWSTRCSPHADPIAGLQERFRRSAETLAEALRELGVDSRVGRDRRRVLPGRVHGERARRGQARRAAPSGWSATRPCSPPRSPSPTRARCAPCSRTSTPRSSWTGIPRRPAAWPTRRRWAVDDVERAVVDAYARRGELDAGGGSTPRTLARARALEPKHAVAALELRH